MNDTRAKTGVDVTAARVSAWRIVKSKFQASALSGEGARLYGGRWNSSGRAVVYLGGSPAIAALEVMAHNARPSLLATSFMLVEVMLPADAVLDLDESALPANWNDPADTRACTAIGDAWLASRASLALRVPSAVLPLERNVIVNVDHARFGEITAGQPQPFTFDPRLAR